MFRCRPARCLLVPALAALAASAWAAPDTAAARPEGLRRNGEVSRYVWSPAGATLRVGDLELTQGIALGLRGALRDNLGAPAAPSLTMRLGRDSTLSLLAGDGGAMLVWQLRP